MENTEDEEDSRYAPKPYYLSNRQKLPLYSHPIPTRHVYRNNDDESQHGRQQLKKRKLKTKDWVPLDEYTESDDVNWSEHEKFVLLETWGDRFLQLGRKSLRNEDWADVAEKVTDTLKIETTETQCRQIMDDLKRRYKRERVKVEKFGGFSKWLLYKKMDMLLMLRRRRKEEFGLACGVDSGEFVFMDTGVYLERSNGFDEMRDSPCESDMEEEEEEEEGEEMRVLADSVQRFGQIYEKMEINKREQMRELEKMRVEFSKELEVQKKQILEKTQAEIAKIREGEEDEDEDDSDDDDESE